MADNWLTSGLLQPLLKTGKTSPFSLPGTLNQDSRILAIDTGDLTDLLFHVQVLQGIQKQYLGARIDFLLPEEHSSLIVPSGLARQCLVYNPGQLRVWTPAFWALLRSVRKNNYDVAILMSLDPNPALEMVTLGSGALLRLGPSHKRSFPAVNFEVRSRPQSQCYRGERPALATGFLGIDRKFVDRCWPLPADKMRRMQQLVHFNKPRKDELLVGIDPGRGKEGHGISLHNLHFLIQQLGCQMPCRVLALSDPHNQSRLKRFEQQLTNPIPGIPRDTLLETILLLAQCDLFVAGNTDLFHFAVALAVPTIGLFTKGDGQDWEPSGRSYVKVLRVAKGQRVDIDTLMETVEAITGGRAHRSQAPTTGSRDS